jgi:hypothetical protein
MSRMIKILLALLIASVFFKMFVLKNSLPWQQRFALFSVPAQAFPYGDFRNVQTAVYCHEQGHAMYGRNPCQEAGLPSSRIYSDIHVPLLNYPPIWVQAYAAGGQSDDESYFIRWGQANAVLLMLALLVLCFSRNHLLWPLMLFSPPALLCVERGNIDGATFAVLFMGLIAVRRPFFRALVVMGAAALKLFPLVALVVYAHRLSNRAQTFAFACGVAAGLALLFPAILNLRNMLADTPGAFEVSFGLWNFRYASFASQYPWLPNVIQLALLLGLAGMVAWSRRWSAGDLATLRAAGREEIDLCLVSLLIFLGTYLFFFNWAYRLIFVMPSVVVLSRVNIPWVRGYCVLACIVMWLPVYGFGWKYFNYAASMLAWGAASLVLPLWQARRADAGLTVVA